MGAPAFETTTPLTRTRPARISARARSRDAARPFATTMVSRRVDCFFTTRSVRAAPDPCRNRRQLAREVDRLERAKRAGDAVRGHAPRGVESEERWIRRLAGGGVL